MSQIEHVDGTHCQKCGQFIKNEAAASHRKECFHRVIELNICRDCQAPIEKYGSTWGHTGPNKPQHIARPVDVTEASHFPSLQDPSPILIDFGKPPEWRGRLTERDLKEVERWQVVDRNGADALGRWSWDIVPLALRIVDGMVRYMDSERDPTWYGFDSGLFPLQFRPAPVDGKWVQWTTGGE